MSCMNNVDPYNNAPPPRNNGGGVSGPPQVGSQRPNIPQPPMQGGQSDPQMTIHMLQSDLNTAIAYIHQLGGSWPPPGQ